MQLRHLQTVLAPPGDGALPLQKVTAIAWAPNNRRLAVATVDRVVHLFDENGEKRDKFSTKSATDKGVKNYMVRAMAFSPESGRLAIAQSDAIVFIYKLGLEWGEKKTICNKFPQGSPVTCLAWPESRPNELMFGLAEGKVKVAQLKQVKLATLYNAERHVTAIAASMDGNGVVSAHADGSIYRFLFDDGGGGPSHARIAVHPSVPYALSWGRSIVAAGNDAQVVFYDVDGGRERYFDYSSDPKCKEFTTASFNPTGDAVVIGNFNRFYVFTFNQRSGTWEDIDVKEVENFYTVTALGWKADGSRLAVGALCGVVDIYDACIKRTRYKGKFEFTYVSLSQVIVKRLGSGARIVLKSHFGCEITKINIIKDRYVSALTTETLLLGDLETFKLSEVPWHNKGGTERFIFDNPSAALVYAVGELSIVEYGRNDILGSIRTDYTSSHLLSVRLNERPQRSGAPDDPGTPREDEPEGQNKKIAYLLDLQTVSITNLVTKATSSVNHDCPVDWLELNGRGNLLLFRDKRRQLHLYNLDTQTRTTLLAYATYVQWVPDSDVIVAQNRSTLCVWYNVHAPDQVTNHEIRGDVYEIERNNHTTEVIVNEGFREASYLLDEALIEFGTAIDDRNYVKAMEILEPLEQTPEADAMWSQLSDMALSHGNVTIAQRCAAALGDVPRAAYLNSIASAAMIEGGGQGHLDMDHWMVRYKMCLLRKDVSGAEEVLVMQGKIEDAINMYDKLHLYEEAISLAKSRRLPEHEVQSMTAKYFQLLLDTNQEERAAALKESEGELEQAIKLYLKGGLPAQAARVLKERKVPNHGQWLETLASALSSAGMNDRAGEMYEEMGQLQRALDSYVKSHSFRKAVDLARRSFPAEVVHLQEMWGDHLVAQKQVDMAINHYIEARANTKAVEASLGSRQWAKAQQLIETLDRSTAKPYMKTLGRHHEEAGEYGLAERFFVNSDNPELAVEMYTKANQWEAAHKLASSYMSPGEVRMLYIEQAMKMESAGKLREAEKLYLQVGEVDSSISMYKKHKSYDNMVRLVAAHRPEVLKDTYLFLGQQCEVEGNMKEAERYYVEAKEWLAAVSMYRTHDMWEDALRVAKYHGGPTAQKKVAYYWALALGFDKGAKVLAKHGLVDAAVDFAIESRAFDHAFELAKTAAPHKLKDVHLNNALFLEDEERFVEAEGEFVLAGKPREAVDMLMHRKDWAGAMRIASAHDPAGVSVVLCGQADDVLLEAKEQQVENRPAMYAEAEGLFLQAGKPERALEMFETLGLWSDAVRICQRHLPHRSVEVQAKYRTYMAQQGKGGTKADYLSSGRIHEQNKNWSSAVEAYLQASRAVLSDPLELEEIWLRAVDISRTQTPNAYVGVVRDVAKRLCEVGRHATAAEILREAQQYDEAADVAIQGGVWDKARDVAAGNKQLAAKVESSYQKHLVAGEATEELVELGQTNAALDILANKGDWQRLWEMAAKERVNFGVIIRYVAMRLQILLKESHELLEANDSSPAKTLSPLIEAIVTIENNGALPPTQEYLHIYTGLVASITGLSLHLEKCEDSKGLQARLRVILFDIVAKSKGNANTHGNSKDSKSGTPSAYERLLMAVHRSSLLEEVRLSGGKDCATICMKLAVSLLRYSDIIPADKVFYVAGTICRTAEEDSLGFVLLNRYVDLTEAIEDNDPTIIDNTEFEQTNVPIIDSRTLPKYQYITEEAAREEIRTWVLGQCVDAKIDQKVPNASAARGTVYEGLYANDQQSCVVTGYPVQKGLIEVNNSRANKYDWNIYVRTFKKCPWTGVPMNPQY